MAVADAVPFPIKNQAYRITGYIKSVSTENPITGGLTTLAATASLDGGAFAGTGLTVAEIGTTGFFTLDIDATRMNTSTTVVKVTSADANSVNFVQEIKPLVMTESGTRADAQTVPRFEQWISQCFMLAANLFTINRQTGAMTLYEDDQSTAALTGTAADDGTTSTRGHLS